MSNYKDLDKQRETQRKYREKNRDKINEYQRENFGAKYMRKWRAERPGQRERDREKRKEYYYENLEQEREKARIAMLANYRSQSGTLAAKKQRWIDFAATKECEHCGLNDPECLDFHHTNPSEKDYTVTSMTRSMKWERIMAEVAKCIVLCANCHRKEHARLRRELN